MAVQGAGLPCKIECIQTECALTDVDNMWFVMGRVEAAVIWQQWPNSQAEAVVTKEVSGADITFVCIQIKEIGEIIPLSGAGTCYPGVLQM